MQNDQGQARLITALAIIGAAAIGYVLGLARAYVQGLRAAAALNAANEVDPWVEAQREQAPWQ